MPIYKDLKLKKRRRERERERARGSYIYTRYSNAYRSPYTRGNAHSNKSGDDIRATHVIVSQVAT